MKAANAKETHIDLKKKLDTILDEIRTVYNNTSFDNVDLFIDTVLSSKKIVCVGAGRMGYGIRSFSMRLKHLGLEVHMHGDATVPSIKEGDLLIVASGSGETRTIYALVEIAHYNGAKIALITGNPDSRMGKLADCVVQIRAPSKTKEVEGFKSRQPMTTLNEQCLWIFCDGVVLLMMERLDETHETMWQRHSNLE